MQSKQGRVLESLLAVQVFLTENADKLASVVNTGTRQKLSDAIAALSGHVSTQDGSTKLSQSATRKQQRLRTELLRDHMAPIARIAASELPAGKETEPLKLPKTKPTNARLASQAHGMATAARQFSDVFVTAGLPTDFADKLDTAADAMMNAGAERMASRGTRKGATQGLQANLSAARKIVRVLDAMVKSALKDNPSLLANWNVIKRVQVLASTTPTPAAATTTPTPTPPATTTPTTTPPSASTPIASAA